MKCKSNGTPLLVALLLGFLNSVSLQCVAEEWTYKVKPGENIWTISEHYLTSVFYWKKLQTLNHIKDPLHISPGTLIKIPVKWLDKSPMVARLHSAASLFKEMT